jgi:hypothetical protein
MIVSGILRDEKIGRFFKWSKWQAETHCNGSMAVGGCVVRTAVETHCNTPLLRRLYCHLPPDWNLFQK